MDKKSRTRELERMIRGHGELARVALDMMKDEAFDAKAKRRLAVAAKYSVEKLDLVPDDFPVYGLMDDLFVLAQGVDEVLAEAGPDAQRYRERKVRDQPVPALLTAMKEQFYGFWEYCRQYTQLFIAEATARVESDRDLVAAIAAHFELELEDIARATKNAQVDERESASFLARFRAAHAVDVDG